MSRAVLGALVLVPAAVLGLAACGDDDPPSASAATGSTAAVDAAAAEAEAEADADLLGPFCEKHAAAEAFAAEAFADVPEEDDDRSTVSEAEQPLLDAERQLLEHLRPYFASIETVPSEVRLDAAMWALGFVTRVESDLTIQPTDAQNEAEERLFTYVEEHCT